MDIEKIIKNKNVTVFPMVGNKYFQHKPNNNDTNLYLERDYDNTHDINAILIKSKRNSKTVSLRFISKFHNQDIVLKIKHYKIMCLLKKKENGIKYYYIACKFYKFPIS